MTLFDIYACPECGEEAILSCFILNKNFYRTIYRCPDCNAAPITPILMEKGSEHGGIDLQKRRVP